MSEQPTTWPKLKAIAPFFFVSDVTRPAGYYRDVLGFGFDRLWGGDPPCFGMPRRDGLTVMLSEVADKTLIRPNRGDDGESWDAYVRVDDADALFAEFTTRGAIVAYPPVDRDYYGNREFAVRDPDGFVIAFAHSIASGRRDA